MPRDVLLTVMNSMSLIGDTMNNGGNRKESCNLEAKLLKSQNAFNDLLKKFFENNDLKAQLQDKDNTICKLKDIIKSLRERSKEENVNYDYGEIETKNVELENRLKCSTRNCGSKPTGNKRLIGSRKHQQSLLNATSEPLCAPCKKSMFDGVHDLCILDLVKNVNSRAKSSKKHKKQNIWKPTGHVFIEVGFKWKPTGRTFTIVGSGKKDKIVESKYANHSKPNHTWGSNATDIPSSSSLVMTVHVAAAPRAVELADSPVSTLIDQDASSTSISSTQEHEHSPSISQDKVFFIKLKWIYKVKTDAFRRDNPSHVYKLKMVLYGLKQAPRAWYDMLSSFLISQHFSKGVVDPHSAHEKQETTYYCDSIDTPLVKKSKLDEDLHEKPVDATLYRGMIGSLMYLTSSRRDLTYAIYLCARYQAKPTKKHLNTVKRIFRYLKGTINIEEDLLTFIKELGYSGTLKFVSKTKDYQKCEALIVDGMINQDIKDFKAYKNYLDYATRKVPPKKARKFKKPASLKLKTLKKARKFKNSASPKFKNVPASPKEPTQKGKRVKRAAKKANIAPATSVVIRDTPGKSLSMKKAPTKTDRGKGIELLSDAALLKDTQLKETLRKSKKETYKLLDSSSSKGADFESEVPDEQTSQNKDTIKGTGVKPRVLGMSIEDSSDNDDDSWGDSEDESDDVHDEDDNDDDDGNDNDSDNDDDVGNDAQDSEQTDDDDDNDDENPSFTLKEFEEEEQDEEYVFTLEKDKSDDEDKMYEEEDDDVAKEIGSDLQNASHESGFVQEEEDAHVTLTTIHDKNEGPLQRSSISSDFISNLQNLDDPSSDKNSLMNNSTVPPPPPPVYPSSHPTTIPQQQTPDSATTTTYPMTTFPEIPNFAQFAEAISLILGIVDNYLASKLKEEVNVAVRLQSNKLKEEAKADNQELVNQVVSTMKKIIKEQLKAQVSKIMPQIDNYVTESLEAEVLDEDPSNGSDRGMKIGKSSKDVEPSKGSKSKELKASSSSKCTQSQPKSSGRSIKAEEPEFKAADLEMQQDQGNESDGLRNGSASLPKKCYKESQPPHTFDELMGTPIDFSAYVMNRLKIDNLTQEILVGPTFNLLKGTCKSFIELEYHFKECYKAVNDKLDWNNPEGLEYPFDLSKPLPLIKDKRCQVVPANYFINKDLEYLKGRSSSSKCVTSTTRTKVAKYDNIEGIEDMVPTLWSPVKVAYNKHDVWERITRVRKGKDSMHMHKFKESDFPRFNLYDIKDMLLHLVQKKLSNLDVDDRYDLGVALRMFTRRIVILHRVKDLQLGVESYQKKLNIIRPETFRSDIPNIIPYTTYKNPQGIIYQDKIQRNRVIDKLLFEMRLMRNLEKFVGRRDYENDLRLLKRTI
nr:hypothetical protein [Tanacetum cinerariifolium]